MAHGFLAIYSICFPYVGYPLYGNIVPWKIPINQLSFFSPSHTYDIPKNQSTQQKIVQPLIFQWNLGSFRFFPVKLFPTKPIHCLVFHSSQRSCPHWCLCLWAWQSVRSPSMIRGEPFLFIAWSWEYHWKYPWKWGYSRSSQTLGGNNGY